MENVNSTQIHAALYAADLLPHQFVDLAVPNRTEPRVLIGYFDSAYELVRTGDSYTVQTEDGHIEFGLNHVSLATAFRGMVDLLKANENLVLDGFVSKLGY